MLGNLHKVLLAVCMFLAILAAQATAQNYIQWSLPKGAKAHLDKGLINEVQYFPDSTCLAVAGFISIWICDTGSNQEIVLLEGHTGEIYDIVFNPNGACWQVRMDGD